MSHWHYERLSALDATFLEVEDPNAHMHIGSVALFDAAPVTREDGGLDFERLLAFIEGQLERVGRFRQKLASIPRSRHPIWIDDESFNLLYHVRHTALPRPGDLRRLKRLAGRIMSQQLDRGKPLWELWFVEGVEGGRFGVISKIHHCLADGISGVDLLASLMGPDPDYRPRAPRPFNARPPPPAAQLVVDELRRNAALPLAMLGGAGRALWNTRRGLASAGATLSALGETVAAGLHAASPTPLNQPIGPHRRFDWTRSDLAELKALGRGSGGTLNDVVLCIVAGALREFLFARGVRADALDFRAMVPVSVRARSERGALGNRVSQLLVPLPLGESDAGRRLRRVVESMRTLKASGQRRGGEAISQIVDGSDLLLSGFARLARQSQAANLVVTNVPGPPRPVYMLGAPLLEAYPVVPLAPRHALGIALFSYAGSLFWGFNSDWDRVRDLHAFVESVQREREALHKAVANDAPGRSRTQGPA